MQRLKFRVWNKKIKHFVDTKNVSWGEYYEKTGMSHIGECGELLMDFNGNCRIAVFPGGNGDNAADSVFEQVIDCEFIIQQFIGLVDKNNKDIYEGDIVRCKYYGEAWYFEATVARFGCHFTFDRVICGANPMQCEEIEIIGNIFENSELLNVK